MGGIITLTTDFGLGEYVGAMKGAILSVDADLTIVDLDHNVRPHDIRHGAYVLYCAVPYYPFAAHVGVVDPGVGTKRRSIVCVCEGAYLVGPDNGVLVPAARRLGLKEVGPVVSDFVDLDFGQPKKHKGGFEGVVITYDRFGNVVTNIPRSLAEATWSFGDRLHLTIGGYELTVPFVRSYGLVAPGEFLATLSSSGFLEISRREANAANQFEATPGMPVSATKA